MANVIFPSEIHKTLSQDDQFGRRETVINLVDNVLTKMQLPNTFGIYGDWGTGKTTFLHFIEEYIIGLSHSPSCIIRGYENHLNGLRSILAEFSTEFYWNLFRRHRIRS